MKTTASNLTEELWTILKRKSEFEYRFLLVNLTILLVSLIYYIITLI